MDTEFLRSISDDQPDMIMMHLDKLPNYSTVYDNDQHNINTTNLMNPNYLMENSDFTNPTTPIPFTSPSQTTEMQFLSSPRWRNSDGDDETDQHKRNSMAAMREMIFRIAAMQPINIDPESIKPPKRRNVKISKDPQSVAARHRRERISERIRILQRLVPGGTKMDTASMLDEAIHYMKFLKNQVQALEKVGENRPTMVAGIGFPVPMTSRSYVNPMGTSAKGYQEMENNNNVYHSLGA